MKDNLANIKERVQEILIANGLDFLILKYPTAYIVGDRSVDENGNVSLADGTSLMGSPYYALVNEKTKHVIHSAKEGYTISQNADIVEMVLVSIESFGDGLRVHKAHSIKGGAKIIIQLEIKGESKVGNDILKRYITIIDSNDGSTSLSVGIGDITMSCMNQFNYFYKSGFRFRHSASITEKIKTLPSVIQEALGKSLKQMEVYNRLAETPVTTENVNKLVNLLIGIDRTSSQKELADASTKKLNNMDTLYGHITHEMTEKGNTLWGLHSGVTRWTTYDKQAPKRENGRVESLVLGTNYKTNQQSFEFVTGLLPEMQ